MPDIPDIPVISVGELTRQIKDLVDSSFPYVVVQGEISNCRPAASGHVYLSLKDSESRISAVIWRSNAARLKFQPADGMEVLAAGRVEVYAARGDYQIIIDRLAPLGTGALELAFRQLRDRLSMEGLFDPEHKRPLPRLPRRIALVTSPTGAAVRDLLQVITRRWPPANIVIVPVPVQGDAAADRIADAIRRVHLIPDVDVVVTGRGGGSLEDLQAFNSEVVARAIFDCPIPVVCAVGHEIDVSIADLVADRRALTPSEAGELVVPAMADLRAGLDSFRQRLPSALRKRAIQARLQLEAQLAARAFARPMELVHERSRQLDDLGDRLQRRIREQTSEQQQQLGLLAEGLDALSPLKVLSRGYAVLQDETDGQLVRSISQVAPGSRTISTLEDGRIVSTVESTEPTAARAD